MLSIIIPTHRRPQILQKCLECIERQTVKDQIEVTVVSDERLETGNRKWEMNVRIFEIPKCHQGVARNHGVKQARGECILFIGDDIFLEPDACEKHLLAHETCHPACQAKLRMERSREPVEGSTCTAMSMLRQAQHDIAVLGFTTWDPAVGITPVMRWLEKSGWQFGYPKIEQYAHKFLPQDIQHKFSYTSHISIPTDIAQKFPFLEDVTLYGWEDIEWGLRLAKAGIPLFYEPDAKALHHHHVTLEDSLKRMEILGRSAMEIEKRNSDLQVVPRGLKKWIYMLHALTPTFPGMHAKAFLRGLHTPNNGVE